jgi:hypothetical membrane protein
MTWKISVTLAVLYVVAVILIAHLFVPPPYDWARNTVSDLAAQRLPYQWIMQAGFIGFGLLLNIGFAQKFIAAGKMIYTDVPVMLYGLAVLLSGFFSTAPFIDGVSYSAQESDLHSLFATAAGMCFVLGIFITLIKAPTPAARWLHLVFLVLVMGASVLFGLSENGAIPIGKGIAQRALYLVSFCWLLLGQSRSLGEHHGTGMAVARTS